MAEWKELEEKKPSSASLRSPSSLKIRARRAFVIHQNDVHIEIEEGDDLSEVPEIFHENLKTEGVI